jgi:serine/threonine-protein kinase
MLDSARTRAAREGIHVKQPRPGLVIASKYRLERPLASGGMGSVWLAQHLDLDVPVAIKFIASAAFKEARVRFQREARAAARIKSPHVVHVQDYGLDGALPYLVMELLQGEDLATRLKREQRLSLEQTLRILVQLAKALRKTHEQGIVHRDLKPGNIFLVRGDDDEDFVKIVDFGIAKGIGALASGEATTTGHVMGSPSYMSPEQVRGRKDIDARTDLWSLAVIVYRALTGRLPFVGEVHSDLLIRIATEPVPPPTSVAPDLPPALDQFFEKALARERDERFQSAREMAEAFALLVQLPVRLSVSSSVSLEPLPPGAVETSLESPSRTPSEPPERGHDDAEPAEEMATSPPMSRTLLRAESTQSSPSATPTLPRVLGRFSRGVRVGAGVAALATIGGGALLMAFLRAPALTAPATQPAAPAVVVVAPTAPGTEALPAPSSEPPVSPRPTIQPPAPSSPVQPHAPEVNPLGTIVNPTRTAEPVRAAPPATAKPLASIAAPARSQAPASSSAPRASPSPPVAAKEDK